MTVPTTIPSGAGGTVCHGREQVCSVPRRPRGSRGSARGSPSSLALTHPFIRVISRLPRAPPLRAPWLWHHLLCPSVPSELRWRLPRGCLKLRHASHSRRCCLASAAARGQRPRATAPPTYLMLLDERASGPCQPASPPPAASRVKGAGPAGHSERKRPDLGAAPGATGTQAPCAGPERPAGPEPGLPGAGESLA